MPSHELDWRTYVRQVIGDDRQSEVARKTGVDQTTVSRWLAGDVSGTRRISSQSVAAFARGYGRPVLEAFVIAGFLTAEEADYKAPSVLDLSVVDSKALVQELARRIS